MPGQKSCNETDQKPLIGVKQCRPGIPGLADNFCNPDLPPDFKFNRTNVYNLKRFRLENLIDVSKADPEFRLTQNQLDELKPPLKPWILLPGLQKHRSPKGDLNYGSSLAVERNRRNAERLAILGEYGQLNAQLKKQKLDVSIECSKEDLRFSHPHDERGRFTTKLQSSNSVEAILEHDISDKMDTLVPNTTEEIPQYMRYFKRCEKMLPQHPGYSHEDDWNEFEVLYQNRKGGKVQPKNQRMDDWRHISKLDPQQFYVTHDMMKSMRRFIAFTEYLGADTAGAITVIPPPDWKARPEGYENFSPMFTAAQQLPFAAEDGSGSVQMRFEKLHAHKYTLEKWYKMYKPLLEDALLKSPEVLMKEYKEIFDNNATKYGKDQEMSGFPDDMMIWNVNNLNSWFRKHGGFDKKNAKDGEGLIKSFLYVSTLYSSFADHVEDFSAYSINYNHIGADRLWRVIPPSFYLKYMDLLQEIHQQQFNVYTCTKFPRHKQLMVPDHILDSNGIRYSWIRQPAGTFVITYPNAWHSGMALGMSIAEASNIAFDKEWVTYAVFDCGCRKRSCPYGDNTTMSIKRWVKAAFGEIGLGQYLTGRLELKNPALLPFQKNNDCPVPFITRKGNGNIAINERENPMPIYPLVREKEDLKIALQVRHFYENDDEIGQELDVTSIMKPSVSKKKKF